MNEHQARDEICRIGKSLFDRGYVHATAGNISVWLDQADGGGCLITPADACLGFLDPARLARLDADARQTSGDAASKTIALHVAIMRANRAFDATTQCVIHTHSTHCVAVSLQSAGSKMLASQDEATTPQRELLPPITPYFAMKVGHVPLIAYHRPGDPGAAGQVAQAITRYGQQGTPIRAVVLERLGPNVWHESPAAAMATLEELEQTARLWHISQPKPEALNEDQINQLRTVFGARW